MELAPIPRRRPWSLRARTSLLLVVLAPVTLLAVMPTLLGLHRYVIDNDSMAGTIDRGSLVYERAVPVGDLEVGDVISYPAPLGSGRTGHLTRRIVSVGDGYVRTQADAAPEPDPWLVPLSGPTQDRVLVHLPLVGYPFLWGPGRPFWWAVLTVPLLLLAAGGAVRSVRRHHDHRGVDQEAHLLR